MSRSAARANLSLSDELSTLEGVIHDIRDESGLDEAPSAYKDIDVVMKNQEDLVSILETLTPLAVVKG
jgi:tRNA-splicing ligase RtcB